MASVFHQKYTTKNENGKTTRKQSKCWYIDYKSITGTNSLSRIAYLLSGIISRQIKQAAGGFEPPNNGFANRRLRPLGHAANNARQTLMASR